MLHRLYAPLILLLWLASMTWLATVKVLPALRAGTPPDYQDEFAQAKNPPPVAWDLYWNDKPVGTTVSRATMSEGVPSDVRSLVRLENLKLREVLSEVLGMFSMLSAMFGNDQVRIEITIATRLRLDWAGEIEGFETSIKTADETDLLFLRGQRTPDDKLQIRLMPGGVDSSDNPALTREINLPTKTRYAESFSPRSRMLGLRVGQRWTTPVVSPLSTANAVQLVESVVERQEEIEWQGIRMNAFVVTSRYDAGSGSASRELAGSVWVGEDGVIVRQQLPLGGARIRLERTTDDRAAELANVLEAPLFDRRLHGNTRNLPSLP